MNGIEKITARIDAQTQEEIDRLLADAKEQAAQITAQYRAQAETERASLTARSEKAAQEREERLVSVAQMEARKVTLSARQEMVERALRLCFPASAPPRAPVSPARRALAFCVRTPASSARS